MSNDNQFSADNVSKLMGIDSAATVDDMEGRVISEAPKCFELDAEKALELVRENKELKAALTDLVRAYLTLSRACGDGLDALNRHAKVVMSLGVDLRETK